MTTLTTDNLVLLRGCLSSPPEIRLLDSGARLAVLQIRVPSDAGATSVPVAAWEPPALVEELADGDEIVVLGRARRRFFRTRDAAVASRVEVVAVEIVPATDGRRAGALLRKVRRLLDAPTA